MKKVHYIINGSIPSDENVVQISTFKFQSIGMKIKKYGWITLEQSHGIGTGTDNFGKENKEEALMSIINFMDVGENSIIRYLFTDNFNEVLEKRQNILDALSKYLK